MKCYNPSTVFGNEYPCGYCYACKLNYSSMWGQRLMNEAKLHKKNVFVTLTYDDDHMPWKSVEGFNPFGFKDHASHDYRKCVTNGLCKIDVQQFLKRLRKKSKVRYYLAGEYGDRTKRPHYHAVLFGLGMDDGKEIDKAWGLGFTSCGDVTVDSCNYVAGYITKKIREKDKIDYNEKFDYEKGPWDTVGPFAIMSRKPGIGADFVDRYGKDMLVRGFAYVKGNRAPLPRYYVNRIVSKDENLKGVVENTKYLFQKEKRFEKQKLISEIGYENNDKKVLDERTARSNNCIAGVKLRESKI